MTNKEIDKTEDRRRELIHHSTQVVKTSCGCPTTEDCKCPKCGCCENCCGGSC